MKPQGNTRMVDIDKYNSSNDAETSLTDVVQHVVLKKGKWTTEEDMILLEYVKKHGEGNWNMVERSCGVPRCGKSCRLRWTNHLRPNLKKGPLTSDEERLVIELHAKIGNQWAKMASKLPGRTDNEIKNYWNTRIKRLRQAGLLIYEHAYPNQQASTNIGISPASYSSHSNTPTPFRDLNLNSSIMANPPYLSHSSGSIEVNKNSPFTSPLLSFSRKDDCMSSSCNPFALFNGGEVELSSNNAKGIGSSGYFARNALEEGNIGFGETLLDGPNVAQAKKWKRGSAFGGERRKELIEKDRSNRVLQFPHGKRQEPMDYGKLSCLLDKFSHSPPIPDLNDETTATNMATNRDQKSRMIIETTASANPKVGAGSSSRNNMPNTF